MLARHRPSGRGPPPARTPAGADLAGADLARRRPGDPSNQPARQPIPGRQRPGGRCRPVWQVFGFRLSQVARSPHRPRWAGRQAAPLAGQRPGDRGAGPGDLGTAGRGVICCSPACRGRRGGRGPELGIGISKPAPAKRAATATAPARPVGSEMVIRVGADRAAGHNMNARRVNRRSRRC